MASSDEQLKNTILDQLYWDQSIDASDLQVDVSGGRVKLEGTVSSIAARRAAYIGTIMMPGVKKVNNQLKLKVLTDTPSTTDIVIKTRVQSVLSWNTDIDADNIEVLVVSGRVVLIGHVNAYWKKMRAEELAGDIKGVREVENSLTVVPTENLNDKLIADNIVAALKRRTDIDIESVDVMVQSGVVILSGTVPNWSILQDVERTTKYTAGVIDVINELGAIHL